MKIICRETQRVLAERVILCDTAWTRLRGLIGRTIGRGTCLCITPCDRIHTCFMSYPIDAVFVDRENRVVHVEPALVPWRATRKVSGAVAVLESRIGWIAETAIRTGQQLVWADTEAEEVSHD